MDNFISIFLSKKEELFDLFMQHMNMTTIAVAISLMIGVPIGILITKNKMFSKIIIAVANIMQSIPCIALLAFAVPFVGIGEKPAILMVIVYALLPIIKNTYTGITSIDPKSIEVAKSIGLNKWQQLIKVELPVAIPFIMSGIRISAVAAVGTMTIAAFAGAKGLGWFINLGLNSRNTALVLLGAIPASILALVIDYILSKLEKAVTSEGLQSPEFIKNLSKKEKRRNKCIASILCAILIMVPAFSSVASAMESKSDKKIVIGSSNYTEAMILGYIYTELIEKNTDIKVEEKFNLNGATFCFDALVNDEIDMFVEYTGTALTNMLKQPMNTDTNEVYNKVSKVMKDEYNIYTSKPLGFNNTYVMSVKPETAKKYNLKNLSDLMKVSNEVRLGCTVEFIQREDCLPLLEEKFNRTFKSIDGLDSSIRYQAIDSGEVDVVDAFSTDALVSKLGLVMLEDDVSFFPPYYAVNFIRQEILDKYPELEKIVSKLDGVIDESTMAKLNAKVDIEGKDAKDVAHEFLIEKNLI